MKRCEVWGIAPNAVDSALVETLEGDTQAVLETKISESLDRLRKSGYSVVKVNQLSEKLEPVDTSRDVIVKVNPPAEVTVTVKEVKDRKL